MRAPAGDCNRDVSTRTRRRTCRQYSFRLECRNPILCRTCRYKSSIILVGSLSGLPHQAIADQRISTMKVTARLASKAASSLTTQSGSQSRGTSLLAPAWHAAARAYAAVSSPYRSIIPTAHGSQRATPETSSTSLPASDLRSWISEASRRWRRCPAGCKPKAHDATLDVGRCTSRSVGSARRPLGNASWRAMLLPMPTARPPSPAHGTCRPDCRSRRPRRRRATGATSRAAAWSAAPRASAAPFFRRGSPRRRASGQRPARCIHAAGLQPAG